MIRRLHRIVKRVTVGHRDDESSIDPVQECQNRQVDEEPIETTGSSAPIDPRFVDHLRSIIIRYSDWIDDPTRSPVVRERARAAMAEAARRHVVAIGTDRPIGTENEAPSS